MAAFTNVGAILTYAALAASPFPMADAALAQADAALGFDWAAWSGFVNGRPVLHVVLMLAYASIPVQGLALVGWLSFRQPRRVQEFLLAAMISILIMTPIMLLLPAVGAPSHHANGMTEQWTHDILALRAHTLTTINEMDGIVFFPSFHTVLGVLLANMARGRRWFLPVLILNLLLIASVPTEGAHYGVDLLSGLGLAFAALAATQFLLARCIPGAARHVPAGPAATPPWATAPGAD
jgi:membrane-associated phospholipid phosphatase